MRRVRTSVPLGCLLNEPALFSHFELRGSNRRFRRTLIVLAIAAVLARLSLAQTGPSFYRTDYYPAGPGPGVYSTDLSGLVVADLNNDGRPDFVVSNSSGITVFLGNGDGSFQPPKIVNPTLFGPLVAADFDGDGNIDLVVWDESIVLLPGKGDGTFGPGREIAPQTLGPNGQPYINGWFAAADLNRDGHPDLVILVAGETNSQSNATVFLNNGNGTFSSRIAFEIPTGETALGVAVADFNRDGVPDLAVLVETVPGLPVGVSVALGKGDGSFASPLLSSSAHEGSFVTAADFNHDGIPDLAVTNSDSFTTSILLGNGDGTFRVVPDVSVGAANPGSMAVADFTGDGKLDLAISSAFPEGLALVAGNGDGTFQPAQILPLGSLLAPWQIVAADLNGDGLPDMVVAATDYDSTSVVTVFLNTGVAPPLIAASAASGFTTVAPASIATVYGKSLAATAQSSETLPLPLDLEGVTANVQDNAGVSRPAPLFYVSPTQINLEIPDSTAPGVAVVTVDNNGTSITGGAFVQSVAPAIFSDGGVAAAYALVYGADNQPQPPLLVDRLSKRYLHSRTDPDARRRPGLSRVVRHRHTQPCLPGGLLRFRTNPTGHVRGSARRVRRPRSGQC